MSAVRAAVSGLCAIASDVLAVVADAIDQPFDERAAADFLTNSAAGVVAEPRSAPVEPDSPAPGADRRLVDPGDLLREAANFIDAFSPLPRDQLRADQLIAGLIDLAAQFDADANPLTHESQDQ